MISYKQFINDKISIKTVLEEHLRQVNLKGYIITVDSYWINKPAIKIELFEKEDMFKHIFKEYLSDKYLLQQREKYYYIVKKDNHK